MTSPRRVDLFSLNALRYHVPLLLGVVLCAYAGWFELSRARAGHSIAWVYAVEWPGFAIAGVVIWWRIVTGREARRPGAPEISPGGPDTAAHDPGLVAWQRYLEEIAEREDSRAPGRLTD